MVSLLLLLLLLPLLLLVLLVLVLVLRLQVLLVSLPCCPPFSSRYASHATTAAAR